MNMESRWAHLRDAVHKTVQYLAGKGVTQAEAFYSCAAITEASIRNSEVLTQNRTSDSGVGFRILVRGNRVGFACTNAIAAKAIRDAGEEAWAVAKAGSAVPAFALPESCEPPAITGLYDARVAETTMEEVLDLAQRSIRAAEDYDSRVIAKDGRIIFESGYVGVVNTLGVDCEEQTSRSMLYLGGNGEEAGEVTSSCYDIMVSRTVNLDPEKVGESFARKVVPLFHPKRVHPFQGTVILGAEAVSTHIAQVLIDALRGDHIASGKSAWKAKRGTCVAGDHLTVSDNPLLDAGFASRSFDDEGCTSQRTILVSKGELSSYLHNATTANTLGESNTGNASRSTGGFDMVKMIIGDGYRALPIVYPSTLVIHSGSTEKEQLVAETEKGILVESLAGFPQAGSGMISAQLSNAFMISEGEIQHALKGGMVTGSAFTWLNHLSGVGREVTSFPHMQVPTLRFEEVKVVGA